MQMLAEMRQRGEALDVTPRELEAPATPQVEETPANEWGQWIKSNV
jgi:hypothetical protein